MKNMKAVKELKIGIFAVTILVVSFFMINYLRGKDLFDQEMELSARYDDVEGLVTSAPVYIKGYKAGKVTAVEYDAGSNEFMVTCSVINDFRIPSDSRMLIYGVDIMGGKGIRIELGTSSEFAEDGDTLSSSSEPALLDGLAASVGPLMVKVGETLDSLNVAVAGVNRMLSEENGASVTRTLAHLEKTMADLSGIAGAVEGRSAELEAFITDLSGLSSRLGSIAEKADTTMADVSSVVSALENSDIEGLVNSFNKILENINNPEGTVGKLLVSGTMYDSVDSLLNDVDELVRKIQENPKKYIKISVF